MLNCQSNMQTSIKNIFDKLFLLIIFIVLGVGFFAGETLAKTDLAISVSDITFSKEEPLGGDVIRVFARVFNVGDTDVYGFVVFSNNDKEMTAPQPISVKVNTYDDVFIDWAVEPGKYNIRAEIVSANPPDENLDNNIAVQKGFFVDLDTDKDGIGNKKDKDDDNDGLSDVKEAKLGTNPLDPDTDNDGVEDKEDALPLDPTETKDNDGDGIGNHTDTDDDNDGLSDTEEQTLSTDPFNPDTDSDSVKDGKDTFPLDPKEWQDADKDEVGDNVDIDDDNDGLIDGEELFVYSTDPLNPDTDWDGLSDKEEIELGTDALKQDTDQDGINDPKDEFPLNPEKYQASIVEAAKNSIEENKSLSLFRYILAGISLIAVFLIIFFIRRKNTPN